LERIRWTLQTLEKKREKGNKGTDSVDLHIPLRREGNFAQQKPPRTGHAAKRSRSAAASHGRATKKRIHGECGTTSSNIDRQSPQEELSVAEQADEALAQPSTPHSQPDEPNPVGSDNADRSAIAQVGDVSPEETELEVVVDGEIELDRNAVHMATDLDVTEDAEIELDSNGVDMAMDLDVTADAEVEFDRNGVDMAMDLDVTADAEVEFDRNGVNMATDLEVLENAQIDVDRTEVATDLEVIDVLDISSADDASEVGETELIQTVEVAEPAADNEEAVRAALRRQSDLVRQQQRRALHRERNLAAIQGAQMRVVAPINIPHAVNNHQSVPVVNLDPPPIIVKNVVQLELVQLMSEADKQRTAKEDAEYAKEEQKAEAAGVVLKPRMSPFADRECCACMMRPAIVTVVGCGHFCLCGPCAINVQAKKYATCPKCRTGQHSKDGELFLQRLY
jgi:Zinc finger, C3HC4 type (RING finger)